MGPLFGLLTLAAPYFPTDPLIRNEGEFEVKGSYSSYETSHFWNKLGKKLPTYNHFHQQEYTLFIEHGATAQDTINMCIAYDHLEESMNGRLYGFPDSEIEWKHRIFPHKTDLIVIKLTAIIPFKATYEPDLRYGRWGGEFSGVYRNFFSKGWSEYLLGYRMYEGFPSSQVRAYWKLGFDATKSIQCILGTFLEYGLRNGTVHCDQNNLLFDPNYRLLTLNAEIVINIYKNYFVTLECAQHLWGQNVGTGSIFTAAVNLVF